MNQVMRHSPVRVSPVSKPDNRPGTEMYWALRAQLAEMQGKPGLARRMWDRADEARARAMNDEPVHWDGF